ncbi:MAG: SDR family NAD(P)-dependent oxidoreductase [Acidimicrobiales bacterium]
MGRFADKVVLVTGGASGIGAASARAWAAQGAAVIVADRNADAGEAVAREVGGRFQPMDVGDPDAWRTLAAQLGPGGIDVAHLNAGIANIGADLVDMSDEDYRRIISVNLDGVVFGTRALVPLMAAGDGGAIVATASLAGLIGFPPDPVYTLTKHGVVGLVRSLAPALQARRITINAICPGLVDTPLLGEARELIAQAGFPLIPPEEIADAVVGAVTSGLSGQAWVCQPGRPPEPYEFGEVPGPRIPGQEGSLPPEFVRGQA